MNKEPVKTGNKCSHNKCKNLVLEIISKEKNNFNKYLKRENENI